MTTKLPERKTPRPDGKKRALLDTNVWRYVVDNSSQGSLLRLASGGPYDVQIAPAVLIETLCLRDAELRERLVRIMTNTRFHRLMPEAYSESMEILPEIERIRPEWLREKPDIRFFNRLKNDWTRRMGGFWVRCTRSPASEARFLDHSEGEMIEGAKAEVQRAREDMINSEWKRSPPMDKTLASFHRPVPGWNGEMVEAWRWDSLTSLTYGLTRRGNAYRDWIAPFVEPDDGLLEGRFGSAAWVEFWLHLADKRAMPRQWMRLARQATPSYPHTSSIRMS